MKIAIVLAGVLVSTQPAIAHIPNERIITFYRECVKTLDTGDKRPIGDHARKELYENRKEAIKFCTEQARAIYNLTNGEE